MKIRTKRLNSNVNSNANESLGWHQSVSCSTRESDLCKMNANIIKQEGSSHFQTWMEIFIGGVEIRDHWDYFLFIWSFFLVFQISVMTQNKEFSFPEWREVGSTNEWRRTYFCLRASLSNICILKLFLCRPRLDTTKHYQWRLNIKIKNESFISDMLPS